MRIFSVFVICYFFFNKEQRFDLLETNLKSTKYLKPEFYRFGLRFDFFFPSVYTLQYMYCAVLFYLLRPMFIVILIVDIMLYGQCMYEQIVIYTVLSNAECYVVDICS
ncbi:hypothetical protein EGW08_010121 [Elysia chlorotica]|uniref:Uncharacterized protein n=1 Tax=Elysia chlorotica TaxID=188477 RepID=A0A3S1BJ82_ELYCH|nr:hypothetical protein EGW08_010121 [Elysia chlorotica]